LSARLVSALPAERVQPERDLLPDHWYALCRSEDLGRSRPLGLQVFGRAVAAFRDADGRAGVLEDRCLHRQAPLSAGRVCEGRLQCPYHGWQYDTGGVVVHVPALEAPLPTGQRAQALPVHEQDGLIWVWPGQGDPGPPPAPLPTAGEPGWTRFIMKTRFRGSVQACLENFLDCPHATFVHRGWFRSPTRQPVRATVSMLADGAVAEYFEEPRRKSVIWALFATPGATLRHTDRFIAPATSCVDYVFSGGLSYNITSTCTPVEGDAIEVFTVMSLRLPRLAPVLGPLVRLFFEPVSRWIIRQDVKMLDRVADNQRRFATGQAATGLASAGQSISTPADLLGPAIWRWRAALSCGAPPPAAGATTETTLYL
jgi:phenylpropionate dioxygenase-like ring-hydroxylating dioxygenase large terminal subunit